MVPNPLAVGLRSPAAAVDLAGDESRNEAADTSLCKMYGYNRYVLKYCGCGRCTTIPLSLPNKYESNYSDRN